ncbi:MAG: response regulator [Candidatus Omnitrophica bacterium]|nr:response regulator [Candidatus Omnitrophota bacterium]
MARKKQVRQKKIIVIDDDKTVARQTALLLAERGYLAIPATNAFEGMRLVGIEAPDLVILDLRMPRLDGFEFLKSLRSSPATEKLPVIIVTALSDPESRLKAKDMGVVQYLVKPCPTGDLLQAVRKLL